MLKSRLQVLSVALLALFTATFLYTLQWARNYATVRPYKMASKTTGKIYIEEEKRSYNITGWQVNKSPLKKAALHNFVYSSSVRTRNDNGEKFDFISTEEQQRYSSWYGLGRSFFDSFVHGVQKTDDLKVTKEDIHIWKSKWLSMTDKGMKELAARKLRDFPSGDRYRSRREELMERCGQYPRNRHVDLSRMVYDDRHKIIMCVVPKAACTTWKRVMWYLMGRETNQSNLATISRNLLTLNNGHIHTLNKLPKSEALHRLETYTSFFVTRQPYERLVSAYSSKLTNRSFTKSTYMKRLGRWIALQQSDLYMHGITGARTHGRNYVLEDPRFKELSEADQNDVRNYIQIMENGSISFEQFIRYILTEEKKKPLFRWDVHWRPQLALCNPCVVNYDHVIRFEDLVRDSNFLLESVQKDADEEQIRLEEMQPWINASVAVKYYETLSRGEDHGIRKVYDKDLRVLGYS